MSSPTARTISTPAIIVSDACFYAKKPLVTAAVGQFDGSLTTLRPFETGPDGLPNPTYRCLFPQKPPPGSLPTCAEAGVLGALTGMLGSLMALEVIREIVGFGESMVGRLALFDLAAMRFETLTYGWDEDNPLNGASGGGMQKRETPSRGRALKRTRRRAERGPTGWHGRQNQVVATTDDFDLVFRRDQFGFDRGAGRGFALDHPFVPTAFISRKVEISAR